MHHGSRSARAGMAGLSALVVLPAAVLAGCSMSNDVMGMGSEQEAAPPHGQSTQLPGPGDADDAHNALVVSPHQQSYLDALRASGVRPSNDLTALSIGSYVCQARAARQTDQAVWDYVEPLVRNDVGSERLDSARDGGRPETPAAHDVDVVTADYIRIATERLC